jgi:hypothetical protein
MVAHGVIADVKGHVVKLARKARLDEHRLSLISYAETGQLVSTLRCTSGAVIQRESKYGESGKERY